MSEKETIGSAGIAHDPATCPNCQHHAERDSRIQHFADTIADLARVRGLDHTEALAGGALFVGAGAEGRMMAEGGRAEDGSTDLAVLNALGKMGSRRIAEAIGSEALSVQIAAVSFFLEAVSDAIYSREGRKPGFGAFLDTLAKGGRSGLFGVTDVGTARIGKDGSVIYTGPDGQERPLEEAPPELHQVLKVLQGCVGGEVADPVSPGSETDGSEAVASPGSSLVN